MLEVIFCYYRNGFQNPKSWFKMAIYLFKPILKVIFVTIPDFHTWVILLINQSEKNIGAKQLSFVGSRGSKISPLILQHASWVLGAVVFWS